MTHRSDPRFAISRPLMCLLFVLALASSASAEWREKVLYSFQGGTDGATPVGGVVFDSSGNLYGATQDGGSSSCHSIYQCGTVYQLKRPAKSGDPWTETILHVFRGNANNDGASPFGGLVIDSLGNLYGTTAYGGTGNCVLLGSKLGCGAIFELSPPTEKGGAWTETVLYSSPTSKQGYVPWGDLVFDKKGNLYGSTIFGGGKGTTCDPFYQYCGTVFELSPPKTTGGRWTEKVLHAFASGTDGANPNGGLLLDGKGVIYGTTAWGGGTTCQGPGCGTAFELEPPTKNGGAWRERILHRFTGGDDGASPNGLIFGARGELYGTGGAGGTQDAGVVFRFAQTSGRWTETVLHSFQGTKDESDPQGLVFDLLGNLYCSSGSIVQMKPPKQRGSSWSLNVLYEFQGPPDGRNPTDLTFREGPVVYGPTQWGGTGQSCQGGCGTVFEVSP